MSGYVQLVSPVRLAQCCLYTLSVFVCVLGCLCFFGGGGEGSGVVFCK